MLQGVFNSMSQDLDRGTLNVAFFCESSEFLKNFRSSLSGAEEHFRNNIVTSSNLEKILGEGLGMKPKTRFSRARFA